MTTALRLIAYALRLIATGLRLLNTALTTTEVIHHALRLVRTVHHTVCLTVLSRVKVWGLPPGNTSWDL